MRAFFSYSREDSDFALRLGRDLRAAGAVVWLDQLDIHPGERWDRSVEDALNECPRMLVILSPASVTSTNVMDEVSFALEEKRTVIPVLYRDCKIPFRLRRLQHIDCRSDYDRGLSEILVMLLEKEVAPAPQPPSAQDSAVPLQALGAAAAETQQSVVSATDARRVELERQERAAAEARKKAEIERQESAAADALRKAELERQERTAAAQREAPRPQMSYESGPGQPGSSMKRYMVIGISSAAAIAIAVWILVGQSSSRAPSPPQVGGQTPASSFPETKQVPPLIPVEQPAVRPAARPSFPCTDIPRSRPIETLLCQDAKLADDEVAMVTAYQNALSALPEEDKPALKANQAAWLKQFTKECTALAPGNDIEASGFRDCVKRHETRRAQEMVSWKPK